MIVLYYMDDNLIKFINYTYKGVPTTLKAYGEMSPLRKWRVEEQDRRSATTSRSMNKLPLRGVGDEFIWWLTGFFEGDGYVGLGKSLVASFIQKGADVLIRIQEELEGGLLSTRGRYTSLRFGGTQSWELLDLIKDRLVCEKRVEQVNNILTRCSKEKVIATFPTKVWFVGFWDAEGWSTSGSYIYIGVGQKEYHPLQLIGDMWGGGQLHTRKDGISTWSVFGNGSRKGLYKDVVELLLAKSLNEPKRLKLRVDLDRVLLSTSLVNYDRSRSWESVRCKLCDNSYSKITAAHLGSKHGITTDSYRSMFPDAPMVAGRVREELYGPVEG